MRERAARQLGQPELVHAEASRGAKEMPARRGLRERPHGREATVVVEEPFITPEEKDPRAPWGGRGPAADG
jgi:hypothetical protein